jgi:uncharacterized membrane protein
MTNSNGNNSDRLDRIERILEATAQRQQETENIVQSNSRLLQAMLEQRTTDRLEHEERMKRLEDTVIRLDDTVARLTRIEEAQNRMLASMDDDRPTVLRRLMSIENKVDTLIERNQ